MFSDHLTKFDETPYKPLLWAGAGLAFVCLLSAFAFVADAQVTKAKIREFQRNAEMQAIAQCIENAPGPARQNCFKQAHELASSALPPAAGGTPKAEMLAGASGESGGVMAGNGASATVSSMLPTQPVQGLMPASFAFR